MNKCKYLYAKNDNTYIIKMIGNVKYTSSINFDAFLDKIFQEKDFDNILIDLTETENIDSTNLGLLAKISRWMFKEHNKKTTLISTNQDITQLLKNLCLDEVFIIIDRPYENITSIQEIPNVNDSEKKMASVILETHKTLMTISKKNENVFKNVVQCLEKNINKSK